MEKKVVLEDKDGCKHEWYPNSHTVNVYCNGKNVNAYSIGDFSKDHASLEDFKRVFKRDYQ
ncbi:MAG: hypothetical protein WC934_04825 [Acidithiobacillus sp.]|jgi:hypothetical protein|uniref:hypothetical protein n=1 Tax=Acidithiobacillus sp. TaxID=1872118 RepID=UPI00355E6004